MAGLLVSPALEVESRQVLSESSLPLGSNQGNLVNRDMSGQRSSRVL